MGENFNVKQASSNEKINSNEDNLLNNNSEKNPSITISTRSDEKNLFRNNKLFNPVNKKIFEKQQEIAKKEIKILRVIY